MYCVSDSLIDDRHIIQAPDTVVPRATQLDPLCETKLTSPTQYGVIERNRLFVHLDRVLANGVILSIVSAPAGSGKTVLVESYFRKREAPVAWMSIDAGDNDPIRFYTYLFCAIGSLCSRVPQLQEVESASPELPLPEEVARLMAAVLQAETTAGIVVLDDYHHISSDYIHRFVAALARHLRPPHHLVVLSREELPIDYLSLWSQGKASVLTASDLAFSLDEINELLKSQKVGARLSGHDVQEATGGWAAGVGLSVRLANGHGLLLAERATKRLLINEVWPHTQSTLQEFMLKTSILSFMTPQLCDAMLGRSDSQKILGALYSSNLFVAQHGIGSYKYYPVFRNFLLQELGAKEKNSLHRQAAEALLQMGLWEEAFHHASESGNWDLVERVVTEGALSLMEQAQLHTLLRWTRRIPRPRIEQNPELALYFAWAQFLTGQTFDTNYWIALLKRTELEGLSGALKVLEADVGFANGLPESLALAQEAVAEGANSIPLFRAAAFLSLGRAHAARGQSELALQAFREAHLLAHNNDVLFVAILALIQVAHQLHVLGRNREALQECEWARRQYVDEFGKPHVLTDFIGLVRGMMYYIANEPETALLHLSRGVELNRGLHLPHMTGLGEWYYAHALEAAGRSSEADTVIASVKDLALRHKKSWLLHYAQALEVEIALRRGRTDQALQWAESVVARSQAMQPEEQMAYVRTMYNVGNRIEAIRALHPLELSARTEERKGLLVSILLMRALLEEQQAEALVKEALEIAVPENYSRPFVEALPELAEVLRSFRCTYPTFIGKLLPNPVPRASPAAELYAISRRELELLELVAAGLSNQQIADRLYISLGTTKWHLHNAFSKLGVKRRAQAIVRAREVGILPDHKPVLS